MLRGIKEQNRKEIDCFIQWIKKLIQQGDKNVIRQSAGVGHFL